MLDRIIDHTNQSWKNVLHGQATTSETIECATEAAASLLAVAVVGRYVTSKALSLAATETAAVSKPAAARETMLAIETTSATETALATKFELPSLKLMGEIQVRPAHSIHELGHALEPMKASSEALEIAARDKTRAYKVLDIEGRSPAAPSVQWPLPTLAKDGTWKPGAWLHVNDTPLDAYRAAVFSPGARQGLHVSNVPDQWLLGHSQVRVFEVELNAADQQTWTKLLQGQKLTTHEMLKHGAIPPSLRDFPASSVRLIRELGVKP
ncbi:MAG: hypothetical protein JSS83_26345 [Cyanobacteria bacterium SZAS LIN-3]|nr:hypothetical protein [Cyanobacteria bacterium SZAS LIN-3]